MKSISKSEAYRIAKEQLDGINHYVELKEAFIFSNDNSQFSIGGEDMPVIVLKESGVVVDSTVFYDEICNDGAIVSEGDIF